MKVGILSGGGDAPGINAVIRAVVRKGIRYYGYEIVGVRDGWRGLLESEFLPLDLKAASGILPRGGSILGTSRTNPSKYEKGEEKILKNAEKAGIEDLMKVYREYKELLQISSQYLAEMSPKYTFSTTDSSS